MAKETEEYGNPALVDGSETALHSHAGSGGGANIKSGITNSTFEGHEQRLVTTGLGGRFRWTAFRLNRGERVNNKGIDLIYKNTVPAGTNYTLRVWLELLKVATIEGGEMTVYFA